MGYDWTAVNLVDFGHKFYRAPDGRIAVADQSGEYPEDTDDGILWLDTERLIGDDGDIPLVDEQGNKSWTPSTVMEMAFSRLFSLRYTIARCAHGQA